MTLDLTWQVQIGEYGSFTDFTSRCLGLSISQQLVRGGVGRGSCAMTFDNNDGALTPNAGGTYAAVDWFSQRVIITGTVTNGTNTEGFAAFHGLLTDFTVDDNGTNSIVTITGDDFLTVAGSAPTYSTVGTTTVTGARGAMLKILNGDSGAGIPGINMPTVGGPDPGFTVLEVSTTDFDSYIIDFDGAPAGQQFASQIMPTGPNFAWATTVTGITYNPAFHVQLANRYYNRTRTLDGGDKLVARPQVFTPNPTGTELTYNEVQTGWNHDDIRNQATVTGQFAGATEQTATNTTSINKYGVSAVTVNQSAANSDSYALDVANRWAKMWDAAVYGATTVTLRHSRIASKCADAAYERYADLLDVRCGLWNTANIEYTPTGAAATVTDNRVLFGRTIRVTPSDTVIDLNLVPTGNYMYFELDSTALGVLDQNRLG